MYFSYEDVTLYYEKYGEKENNIIILPGWGDTRKTFDYMINFLKNYATIYILDYPGFGNSPFPNHHLTIYDYTNIIYEWIKSLEIQDPILIGHSFGGRIITTLTGYYEYPFSNIILLDSAGIKPKKTIKQSIKTLSYKFLKKLGKLLPKKIKNTYQKYLFSHFASTDYQNIKEEMRQTFKNIVTEDLKPYLSHITSRTLLIWGSMDDATPIKDAYLMKKLIKNAELIILDGCNHFPYLQQPYLINQILLEQLKEIKKEV